MRLRRYLSILTLCALIGVTLDARAQTAEGRGIRLGDALVLHLSMGVGVEWDSNVFYTASNEVSSFLLRVTPGFDLTNRLRGGQGSRRIQFDLHGGLAYIEYLTNSASLSAHRQFAVDAGLQAAFFPMSAYNFVVFDNYIRTTQPPYNQVPYNLDRDTNNVGIRVNLSPGGGRLTFNVGYLFGFDLFELDLLKPLDVLYHRFDLRASWRFLPKTALYIAASEAIYQYPHPGVYAHPNSYPFHVDAGLQGLITPKLTLNLWIGYGNGFYVSGPSPNTVVGGASATWKPTLLSTGTIGYQHDFENSLLGAYYDLDQAYLSWTQLIWRFTGFIRASYANERFQGIQTAVLMPGVPPPTPPSAETNPNRSDNIFTLNLRVDYPFKDWLFASVGYDLQLDRSSGKLDLGTGPGLPGIVPVDYTKHVVYLRLTASY